MELLAIAVLSFVLGITLIAYDRKARESSRLQQNKSDTETRARQKALKMVEDARDRALAIVQQAKIAAGERQELVDRELEEASDKQMSEYKNVLQSISLQIETEAAREVEEFRKVLEMEAAGAQKAVTARMEEEYQRADQLIEAYRLEKMKQVDEKAVQVLKELTRQAVMRGLSLSEHTELLLQALAEAKKHYGV